MQKKEAAQKEKKFEPRYCTEPDCTVPTKLFKCRRTLYAHRKKVHTVAEKPGVVAKLSAEEKKEKRRAIDKARSDARR